MFDPTCPGTITDEDEMEVYLLLIAEKDEEDGRQD